MRIRLERAVIEEVVTFPKKMDREGAIKNLVYHNLSNWPNGNTEIQWPPEGESRSKRQRRITETLKVAKSSKRKAIPLHQLKEFIVKLELDLKAEGNALFCEKEISKACICYNEVLNLMTLQCEEGLGKDWSMEETVLCNRAECLLRFGDKDSARQVLDDCDYILKMINPHNEKAMFRKAKAMKKLGFLTEALITVRDLQMIRKDAKVSELAREIRRLIEEKTERIRQHNAPTNGHSVKQTLYPPWITDQDFKEEEEDDKDFDLHMHSSLLLHQGMIPPMPPESPTVAPAKRPDVESNYDESFFSQFKGKLNTSQQSPFGANQVHDKPIPGPEGKVTHYSDIMGSKADALDTFKAEEPTADDSEVDKSWLPKEVKSNTQTAGNKGKRKKKKRKKKKQKSRSSSASNNRNASGENEENGKQDLSGRAITSLEEAADDGNDSESTVNMQDESGSDGGSDNEEENLIMEIPGIQSNQNMFSALTDITEHNETTEWTTVHLKKQSKKMLEQTRETQTGLDTFENTENTVNNRSNVLQQEAPTQSIIQISTVSKRPTAQETVGTPDKSNRCSVNGLPVAIQNMLKTHDFRLACKQCYTQTHGQFGQGSYRFNSSLEHSCWVDILLCAKKSTRVFSWKKIRSRTKKNYTGKYRLCNEFDSEEKCAVWEENCYFCHSEEEVEFWTIDRQNVSNRQRLVSYLKQLPGCDTSRVIGGEDNGDVTSGNLTRGVPQDSVPRVLSPIPSAYPISVEVAPTDAGVSYIPRTETPQRAQSPVISSGKPPARPEQLTKLLIDCGGQFVMCCKDCFLKSSRIIVKTPNDGMFCSGDDKHPWKTNEMMMHVVQNGKDLMVGRIGEVPPKVANRTRFVRCIHAFHINIPALRERCTFPHSEAEKAVWELEAVTSITRNQIVAASTYYVTQPVAIHQTTTTTTTTAATPSNTDTQPKPKPPDPVVHQIPFKIKVACKGCWIRTRQLVEENPQQNGKCAKGSHEWKEDNQEIMIFSEQTKRWVDVNSIPQFLLDKNQTNFKMCIHKWRGKDHYKQLMGRDCANPHSPEEMMLWRWQSLRKVSTLKDLVKLLKQKAQPKAPVEPTPRPQPQHIGDTPIRTPLDLARFRQNEFYCDYCNKRCNSRIQLQQHFTSSSHRMRVISDKDREWNYRPPPWNVHEDRLRMCPRESAQAKSCPYGECTYAHSEEELEEWKERAGYRQMKRKFARERHLFSFMDTLIEKYHNQRSSDRVLSEFIEDVDITCDSDTVVPLLKDDSTEKMHHQWRFKLSSNTMQLIRVGLLYDLSRQHFHLMDGKKLVQIASGSKFTTEDYNFEVPVSFESQIFGSFHQWVVFDFGSEPALVKKLTVHVGSSQALESIRDVKSQTAVTVWNSDNSVIVPFQDFEPCQFDGELLQKYKDPSIFQQQMLQVREFDITKNNYTHQMHRLLYLEELSQMKILEGLNCKTSITLLKSISVESTVGPTTHYTKEGELFSQVQLQQELSDDYEAGRIVLRSVTSVLIKPCQSKSREVYEAKIVSDRDFSGVDKQAIFIQLGQKCCKDLELQAEQKIEIEIQFRMNRLPFCRQHYAIDGLAAEKLKCIFPSFKSLVVDKRKIKKIPGLKMNSNQLRAVAAISATDGDSTTPLIIYGPFGTGKTYTMAMSIKQLVTKRPDARILLCTISNSAADLYITEYFDDMVKEGCTQIRPLRIYAGIRRLETIHQTVAKYCPLQEAKRGVQQVRMPTDDDITEVKKYSVVVTTLTTSVVLQRIGLEGHFTHVFIDEAGQALETEAIMPITLAGRNTKIILAGDHQQMSPEVHSDHAKRHRFDQSLLTRLFKVYIREGESSQPHRIMLDENYRCQEQILKFISVLFYGKALIASSDPPQKRHPQIYPLAFYSANGEEEKMGTSYYNKAEVLEISYRVEALCRDWPKDWGKKDLRTIGVVSPYSSQVQQIRNNLRKKGLGAVTVERVLNVQGKEFRALFISTVRTRKVAEGDDVDIESLNLGFLSDRKLLNTALTRAQSLVAVIGDPIALCSMGKCSNNWRSYISECEKNQSVHPDTLTIESIEQQVLSTHNELDPRAKEFTPRESDGTSTQPGPKAKITKEGGSISMNDAKTAKEGSSVSKIDAPKPKALYSEVSKPMAAKPPDPATASTAPSWPPSSTDLPALQPPISSDLLSWQPTSSYLPSWHPTSTDVVKSESQQLCAADIKSQNQRDDQTVEHTKKTVPTFAAKPTSADEESSYFDDNIQTYDEWESDDEGDVLESLDIDEILQELARQLDETRRKIEEGRAFEDVEDSDEEVGVASRERIVGGQRVSHQGNFQSVSSQRHQYRRQLGTDHDEDYDSDTDEYMWDPYENETLETDESTLIKEYGKEDLDDMMSSNPNVYKRCKLYIEPARTYAVTLDETEGQEIEITTKLKRGRALNNDEVVVEILNSENDFPEGDERRDKTYGRVIGILERAVEPRLQKIACVLDEYAPNLMAPLNRSLPKMIWIQPRDDTASRSPYSIPICTFTKAGDLKVKRHEKVTNKERPNKVFLVRFLHWNPRYRYPICVAVDVLPYGDTLATGTAILKTVYGVKAVYKIATKQEIAQKYPDNWTIPSSEVQNRENLQDLDVFTVDPAESTDLDDALSVEVLEDDQYRVGIHIADVSFFVHPDSELDKEARRRATSHYPWKQTPIHMLPPQLSTKLCSLLPGKPRLALTLFLTFTEDAEISSPELCCSVIRSKAKLSYEQAEEVINGGEIEGISDNIKESIQILHKLTDKVRTSRLGDGRFCCSYESDDDTTSPQAHSMIEELMLLANMHVANLLVRVFPDCTPLRRQKSPQSEKLSEWKTKHSSQIPNSLNMVAKSELLQLQEFLRPGQGADVDVLNTVWEEIVKAIQFGDTARLQKLLLSDQNHPQLAVMLASYLRIQERSIYISSSHTNEETSHFSLNVPEYTHFTSPIRRYIDLVVHRLVYAYLSSQEAPYSGADIMDISKNCNQQAAFAKEFERATVALHIATTLKEEPVRSLAFIASTSDGDVELHTREHNRHIPSEERILKFSALQPCEKPVILGENGPVTLKWKGRIYENKADQEVESDRPSVRRTETSVLSPDRFVKHIPGSLWQEMMRYLITENRPKLQTVYHRISIILNNPISGLPPELSYQPSYCTEVTSEGVGPDSGDSSKHFCQFQRTYTCGDVAEVQLSISMKKGTLTPVVQLFNLTPMLDFCVEHRSNPIHCFAEIASERTAILRNKRNIADYQRVWRRLLAMVSAYSAVTAGETVTIHDVGIQWSLGDRGTDVYEGIFRLSSAFCMTRQIKFDGCKVEDKNPNRHYGFLCVRYQMKDGKVASKKKGSVEVADRPVGFRWVGHCVSTAVERNQEFTEVHIKLNQSTNQIPDRLLQQQPNHLLPCTVEWIPQTMPDRRAKDAMNALGNASKFVQDICLGRKITMGDNALALTVRDTEIKTHPRPFYKLNSVQDQAVRTALSKSFTLIQGPPGTGKTVTGVHIAFWFVHLNQLVQHYGHKQVLYCGPSNKSIDVVTAYLKKIAHLRIVRVYSESIERQTFPVPGMPEYPLRAKGSEVTMAPEHRNVSLHYLIRKSSNPYHQQLKYFDDLFRDPAYSYDRTDELSYRNIVREAEKLELQRNDIILCTCVTAGGRRIAEGTQIHQCIVDECGMCTEPETIVPLVTTEPKQVVLIGDHKQLRPIVTEDIAKKAGMEISMLERYEKKATMLTLQYRMHPGICRFPSDHFYDRRLETAVQVLQRPRGLDVWPGGEQNPTLFCHIVGTEEKLTVSTAEGSEQSRSNLEEVEQVVRMALTLVIRYHVNPASIIILSQYRAQCSEITKRLEAKGRQDIAVSTVIISQGSEWDYVIFSTVRSLPRIEIEEKPSQGWLLSNLGFITDEHQINVAITRAKRGLVIVGNKELLGTHNMWKHLLQKYEQDGCLVEAREFLQLPMQ